MTGCLMREFLSKIVPRRHTLAATQVFEPSVHSINATVRAAGSQPFCCAVHTESVHCHIPNKALLVKAQKGVVRIGNGIVILPSPTISLYSALTPACFAKPGSVSSLSVRERALALGRRLPLACQLLRLGDLVRRHLRFKFGSRPGR